MWFPGIPLSILNGFIFIALFLILKKYLKKSKAQEKTYFIGWGLILILSLLIDLKSYDYTNDQMKMAEDFPYYDNLEWWDKVYYGRCILSFSYYGKGVCQKIFNEIPSLNNPTNENLSSRLEKCHFKTPNWKPKTFGEIEHSSICNDALRDLGVLGDKVTQAKALKDILAGASSLSLCKDKVSFVSNFGSKLIKMKDEVLEWELNQCLKQKCYKACYSLTYNRFPTKSFERLRGKSIFYNGVEYYPEEFIAMLMKVILMRKWDTSLGEVTLKNLGFQYIFAFYKKGKLDFLVNSAEDIISKEIPQEAKGFNFDIFRNIKEIKRIAKLRGYEN